MADRDGCDNSSAGQTGTEMRSWFQDLHDTAAFSGLCFGFPMDSRTECQ